MPNPLADGTDPIAQALTRTKPVASRFAQLIHHPGSEMCIKLFIADVNVHERGITIAMIVVFLS